MKSVHPVDEMLPLPKLVALGLQHVLVMYANAVAVPLIVGGALHLPKDQIAMLINADLFACGIATLLEKFKDDVDSVLFGTDSFWQGVDVPGEALSNVIITRLPFAVPDHPLIQARLERIEARGGNAFFEFSLPEAVLKFRQGVGRLIRTATDQGIVVVLDNRVLTKRYGQAFLDAIPKCPMEVV